jgi:hypothetical protein
MHQGFETAATERPEAMTASDAALSVEIAEVVARFAQTVRSNSKRHGSLTPGQTLTALAKDLHPQFQKTLQTKLPTDDGYRDIKSIMTSSRQIFFYSLAHMSASDAEAKGRIEEMKHVIAEKIRRDSRVTISLTPLHAIYALWSEMRTVKICSILNEMQAQDCFGDIKTVSACSGALYLYCDRHITEKYAVLLARTAVNDTCTAIAHTVREESRIYPRPINVTAFTSQVFGIPPASLQPCIMRVLNHPEFSDIRKLVHPDTRAVYLYSNKYMSEVQALSVMKWLEESASRSQAPLPK